MRLFFSNSARLRLGNPVRLSSTNAVRRLRTLGLALVSLSAVPMGLSVTGCGHKAAAVVYCNSSDTGPVAGQVANISLSPTLATTGLSLNYQQIGQSLSASATDCKDSAVSVSRYTYATSNMALVDINPSTGQTCAGIWNRNTGGGIADYTLCNPYLTPPTPAATAAVTLTGSPFSYTAKGPGALSITGGTVSRITLTDLGVTTTEITPGATTNATSGIFAVQTGDVLTITYTAAPTVNFVPSGAVAYVTASASGATSNAIAVYIHPIVTGIVLGAASTTCSTDPGTDCCPNNTVGTTVTASPYTGSACISQGKTGQLIARIYASGNTSPANNVTCQVGHISFAPLTSSIVSIDENGIATANLPGSTLITANVSNSSTGTQAGFFSTCPPASITLTNPSTGNSNPISVGINNLQPLTAVVKDTNGVTLNGLNLEFNSTTPQTIPATTGSVTPSYPGTAIITAVCLPGTCDPAPFSQIGLYGNGQPLTSNGITINAVGTASTVIYMGSTSSQYVLPRDFTLNQPSSLIKLPYLPNSMVITQDGSSIYLGSTQGLMSINTANNAQGTVNESAPGKVLAVSPDGGTVVITDPSRQTVSLYSPSAGGITASYGGIATSAKWSPDSQTVYITLQSTGGTNQILTHSNFTNWQATPLNNGSDQNYTDVAVMVPAVGAFFAGGSPTSLATEGRSYCPSGTVSAVTSPPTVTNTFAPLAAVVATPTDKVAATNDGIHILGATVQTATPQLSDINLAASAAAEIGKCPTAGVAQVTPAYFTTNFTTTPLSSIAATAIKGVVPAANSSLAFVTYTGTSGVLPEYIPAATGAGTLKLISLGNGAGATSAPVSGVFSTDGLTFFAGTSGDDQVHLFTLNGTTATESSVITPSLPLYTGFTPANDTGIDLLVQKPKKTLN